MPEVYDLYAMAHTGFYKKVKAFSASDLDDPKNFTNNSAHDKLVQYRDQGKARKVGALTRARVPLIQSC